MRKHWIVGGAVLAVVAAGALWRGTPTPTDITPATALVSIPPEAPPKTDAGKADAASAAPKVAAEPITAPTALVADPAGAAPAAIEAPPARVLPPLPTREVAMRPAHIVPEDEPLPPARPIDIRQPPDAPSRPAALPASHEAARRKEPRHAPALQIAGSAEVSGATALLVGGQPLRLFGVRPPSTVDRCAPPNRAGAAALPCTEEAHKALVARLARNAGVSCRMPAPSSAAGAAICLDAEGVDLGGLLVAEGLALADPAQSYDYVGAEAIARTQHRGLWLFR